VTCSGTIPTYGEVSLFDEYTIYQNNFLLKHVSQSYKAEKASSEILDAKISKCLNYIVIQILSPCAISKAGNSLL